MENLLHVDEGVEEAVLAQLLVADCYAEVVVHAPSVAVHDVLAVDAPVPSRDVRVALKVWVRVEHLLNHVGVQVRVLRLGELRAVLNPELLRVALLLHGERFVLLRRKQQGLAYRRYVLAVREQLPRRRLHAEHVGVLRAAVLGRARRRS